MDYHLATGTVWLLVVLGVWELVWKALALWRAARLHQKAWYIVILIINSVGVIPIVYLLVSKKTKEAPNG